jgi:broad specificity phosphatase PhoE
VVAELRAVTLEGRDRRVVLLRHGQTAWNAEGRAQGHADVGLDDTGRRQAEQVAPVLAALDPSLLVSSDLARARETAAFLEKETGLTAVEDPRWREYELGERTGLTLAEFGEQIGAEFDGWWDVHAHVGAHVEVPGAESPEQLAARVLPAFEEVLARGGRDRHRGHARRLAPGGARRHPRVADRDRGGPRGDAQLRLGDAH